MIEEWKPINGYEEYLEVSSFGNIRNIKTGNRYKFFENGRGYNICNTSINGKRIKLKPHREVAKNFIPNPNDYPIVNHIDGNKKNNKLNNLEWMTPSQNTQHAFDTGLAKSGLEHHSSCFTQEDIDFILNNETLPRKELALKFDCCVSTIYRTIKRYKGIQNKNE